MMKNLELSKLRAFIFDLDGTVVDSKLDFDQMRLDLGFPVGVPILEELELIDDPNEVSKANQIIHEHELKGAEVSTIMPGYLDLHHYLKSKNIPIGLLTRNSTAVTKLTCEKYNLHYDLLLTRDDCKAKPHPEGLNIMKERWNIGDYEAIYIGDFQFDLITAKAANLYSGLYLNEKNTKFTSEASIVIESYQDLLKSIKV